MPLPPTVGVEEPRYHEASTVPGGLSLSSWGGIAQPNTVRDLNPGALTPASNLLMMLLDDMSAALRVPRRTAGIVVAAADLAQRTIVGEARVDGRRLRPAGTDSVYLVEQWLEAEGPRALDAAFRSLVDGGWLIGSSSLLPRRPRYRPAQANAILNRITQLGIALANRPRLSDLVLVCLVDHVDRIRWDELPADADLTPGRVRWAREVLQAHHRPLFAIVEHARAVVIRAAIT